MARPSIARFLRVRRAYSPTFSQDSTKLAFISDMSGIPQAYVTDAIEPTFPEPITPYGRRVGSVKFCPTSDLLAYSYDVDGNERFQISLVDYETMVKKDLVLEEGVIHHLGPWSPKGNMISYSSNKRDRSMFDVYLRSLNDEERLIYRTHGNIYPADWSKDGRYLLATFMNTNLDMDVYLIDIEKLTAKNLTKHTGEATFFTPRFSHDGDGMYVVTNLNREFAGLAYIKIPDGQISFLDTPDWDVEELSISPDGYHIAYTVNVRGYSELRIIELGSKEIKTVLTPKGIIYSLTFSPNSRFLGFTLETPTQTSEIYVISLDSMNFKKITNMPKAGIGNEWFTEPQLVTYESFDGLNIDSWLYLPRGAKRDGKNAAIVYAHGGPESQVRPSFIPFIQFLASKGFIVMAPNFRGSTGYGKKFVHMDDLDRRMDAVKDVVEAAKWLSSSGWADPNRIGIIGGSYGGFVVLACLTQFPDVFAAGVELVGIFNFLTFLKETGPWRRKLRANEYGDPEKDRDFLEKISPINNFHNIRSPLLAAHGKNDPRVPVHEIEQIIEVAKCRNVHVEYMLFEDEGHGLAKLENRIKFYNKAAEFFEKYLLA